MINFIKNLFKKPCSACGSKSIEVTKHKKLTGPPPGVKRNPHRKETFGYFFKRYTCECGNVWEIRED